MKNVIYTYEKKNILIEYEEIDEGIYIHSIKSLIPKKGYGSRGLKKFMEINKDKNIYLLADSSLGTSFDILYNWYIKMGFTYLGLMKDIKYDFNFLKKGTFI